MTDKIVTIHGVAAMARAGVWPHGVRTPVGVLESGEPVTVYCGAIVVDMRPTSNRLAI
jgi:hypothetical protein